MVLTSDWTMFECISMKSITTTKESVQSKEEGDQVIGIKEVVVLA